jgi:hypothetical protein
LKIVNHHGYAIYMTNMISSARIAIDKTRKVAITLSKSSIVINISSSDIDLGQMGSSNGLRYSLALLQKK